MKRDREFAPEPIAILAASGELPVRLADCLADRGQPHRILAFHGFCDRALRARADAFVGLLDIRGIEAILRGWNPSALTLAGGLTRPSPAALIGAFAAVKSRHEIAELAARGDDNLLRGALDYLESQGFELLGLRDLAPELLAPIGVYTGRVPTPKDDTAIGRALAVLDAISPFDVGQAIVVAGEQVLAIEGPEGTDRMLDRVAAGRRGGLFRRRRDRGGVLVKAPKRGQDLRVDLPAIGPRTVARAVAAGLDGIAVSSGLAVVIDRAGTVAAADRAGLFVVGIDRAGPIGDADGD